MPPIVLLWTLPDIHTVMGQVCQWFVPVRTRAHALKVITNILVFLKHYVTLTIDITETTRAVVRSVKNR